MNPTPPPSRKNNSQVFPVTLPESSASANQTQSTHPTSLVNDPVLDDGHKDRQVSDATNLLAAQWAKPGYSTRLKQLSRSNGTSTAPSRVLLNNNSNLQPISATVDLINVIDYCFIDLGGLTNILKDIARDLGNLAYSNIKPLRNGIGAVARLYDVAKSNNDSVKNLEELKPIIALQSKIVTSVQVSGDLMQIGAMLDAANTDPDIDKDMLSKFLRSNQAALKALDKTAFETLRDSLKPTATPKKDTLIAALGDLIEKQKDLITRQDNLLLIHYTQIKAVREGITVINEDFKKTCSEELNDAVFGDSIDFQIIKASGTSQAKEFLTACGLLFTSAIGTIGKLFGLLSFLLIPGANVIASFLKTIQIGLNCMILGEYANVDAVSLAKSINRSTHAKQALAALESTSDVFYKASSSDFKMVDLELKGILKGIERQQALVTKSMKAFSSGLALLTTGVAAAFIAIEILTLLGVVSGAALALISPISWTLMIVGLATTVVYLSYTSYKSLSKLYKASQYEKCLQASLTNPVPQNAAELAAMPSYYRYYFSHYLEKQGVNANGQVQKEAANAAHHYVQGRALSRLLQHKSGLLVETIYNRLQNKQDPRRLADLLEDHNILDPKLVDEVKNSTQRTKKQVMVKLTQALGF